MYEFAKIFFENLKERLRFYQLDVDGRIIFKRILKIMVGRRGLGSLRSEQVPLYRRMNIRVP